jgi:hypothetical protein
LWVGRSEAKATPVEIANIAVEAKRCLRIPGPPANT